MSTDYSVIDRYRSKLLCAKTVLACEAVLRELAMDPEVSYSELLLVKEMTEQRAIECRKKAAQYAAEAEAEATKIRKNLYKTK